MNNKKIRIGYSNNKSIVNLNIVRDKNISANAKILITLILNDPDDQELSQSHYCKILGWEKNQFTTAIKSLINGDYIIRTQIDKDVIVPGKKKKGSDKILYFYTVNENGNNIIN